MHTKKIFIAIITRLLFKKKEYKNALIINEGALGDYLHSIPAINAIPVKFDVITKPTFTDIYPLFSYTNYFKAAKKKYDIILNFNSNTINQNYLLTNNTYDFLGEKILRKYVNNNWKEVHWSDYYLSEIKNIFNINKKIKSKKRKSNGNYIVIHPGSSMAEKNWDLDNFIWLGKMLNKKHKVIFLIGPQDKSLKEKIISENFNIFESNNFNELNNLAKKTKLYIGNDSGPMHFFSLYTCKVLGIYTIGCADTHYPYTNNGWYYFERNVFEEYYKNHKINKIKLKKEDCLKQINHILKGSNILETNFFKAKEENK